MGIDVKEILISIRKAVVYSVRAWCRSLYGHPFLWVMVFCCLLVYRFLPSVFAFFLSSAPVIVCTAVLLGTLLSLGQSNIPKAEEDKRSPNISALKSVGAADNFVEEKDRSFSVETHVGKRREEKAIKEDKEIRGEEGGPENEKITGSRLEVGDKQIEGLFADSRWPSSWKEIEGQDESSDSDSDSAESSSPDASMTDIMPMLDELHPLLDANPPKPAHKSSEDSEESSHSHESDNASEGSAEEGDNQEEEAHEDPEDHAVGVVTWTEDDEKNLKDIKTSELERNRKMENLIAKRIATKNQKAMAEGNLIDLDSIPMQIPAVSTARRNPFDLPYNSDDITGLPPIPGSAPSVLLPRMNPFDLPYDQAIGGGRGVMGVNVSHQGFSTIPQREIFFRRHESFTLGASFPAEIKQENQESSRLKPFFVLERTGSEETSSSLLRQMSEKSDSKMSSVPETDTISPVADQDNVEVLDHEGSHLEEKMILPEEENVEEIQSESSEEVNSVDIEQEQTEINLNDSEVSFKGVEEEVEINPAVELEVVDHKYGGGSSSSSLSEGHGTGNLEMSEDDPSKWSTESIPSAMAEVEQAEEVQTVGPVYDSSPSARENLSIMSVLEEAILYGEKRGASSASSVVADTKLDILERSIPLMAVGGPETISANGSFHREIGSTSEEFWTAPPNLAAVDEDESRSMGVTEISEQDVIQVGLSGVQRTIAKPVTLESGPEQALHVTRSSSLNTEENHNDSQANLNELVYEPVDKNSSKISEMEAEFVEHQITDVGFVKPDEVKGEVGSSKPRQPEECSSEQEVLEVRSLEDVYSAFEQTEVEKSVLSEEELIVTRSIEDPSLALKHFNEGDIDKPVVLEQLVESEVRPVELEEREIHTKPIINEVESFETIEPSVKESAVQETSLSTENCSALKSNEEVKENTGSSTTERPTAEKSTEKVKEAFDNLSSKRKDKKKAKPSKPSTSSSSSSNSSSSDSD